MSLRRSSNKAVLDTCQALLKRGAQITYAPVNSYGQVTLEALEKALTPQTILVSLMAANNEIGSLHDLKAIGSFCKARGILFHTDAVQAAGKIPLDVEAMGIDLLSLSAHKMYGPKGVGALYIRRRSPRVRLSPQMFGGGHERGMRSGTLNVPGIVGLGVAAEISASLMGEESARVLGLRNKLWNGLQTELDEIYLNGHPSARLPGNLNVSFAFVEGESLMMGMKELAVSSGSACTSASLEPSYVLRHIGVGEDLAHTSIRFGLGRFTTEEEIAFTVQKVVTTVKRLRELSPLYEMMKDGIDLASVSWATHPA